MEPIYESAVSFNTPENGDFYQQNPYQSLNHDRREIRLLRIYPKRLNYYDIIETLPQFKKSKGVLALKPKEFKGKPKKPRAVPWEISRTRNVDKIELPDGWLKNTFIVSVTSVDTIGGR
jgi:hypothetical protein